jgi:hypothetical protein
VLNTTQTHVVAVTKRFAPQHQVARLSQQQQQQQQQQLATTLDTQNLQKILANLPTLSN